MQSFGGQRGGDGQGGDHRPHVGFEDIGAHAGDVADVVADVVGDDAGIARVVFRDARLDLAHKVAADVGGLGVDSAAHAGEQGDGACAHRESVDVDGFFHAGEDLREDPDAKQAKPGYREAHHRSAAECDEQRGARALGARGFAGARVGLGGRFHSDETGDHGEDGSGDEADGGFDAEFPGQQRGDNDDEDAQDAVFAIEKGHRAAVDQFGDFPHALIAWRAFADHDEEQQRA